MSQQSHEDEQQELWEEQSQDEEQQELLEELLEAYIDYHQQLLEQELGLQQPQATVDYSQFMSFLTPDKSFFTPWSWNTNAEEESNNEEEQRIILQPGSFFSQDVIWQVPYVEPKESSDQLEVLQWIFDHY
ncbi:hypothetical protein JCGZ_06605 [Jatropha curcas]|uniref:Uncharacterized protein n=1 Tax=Jatropha curcas TaxID=180498 RepID=A0A067LNP1_JATCU|nr:hypothetical protein JCGZ_06605 [Jatropha curcas]